MWLGRPVEIERLAAEHLWGDRTEFGNAAIETVGEIVADDEERVVGNYRGFESGVIAWVRPLCERRTAAGFRWGEWPTSDDDAAVRAGTDSVAGKSDDPFDKQRVRC